jgi:adenine-specific DNA-methyltransferase
LRVEEDAFDAAQRDGLIERTVDFAGQAMPMQRIETFEQPRFEAAAAGQIDLFDRKTKRQDGFRNMLIWGENKLALAPLQKESEAKVNLVCIDPPFDVGASFKVDGISSEMIALARRLCYPSASGKWLTSVITHEGDD